jgi:hypothetical protein
LILLSEAESTLGLTLGGAPGYRVGGYCFNTTADGADFRFEYQRGSAGFAAFDQASGVPIDDVGSSARWNSAELVLHVQTDGGYFWVMVPPSDGARRRAVALAEIALSRAEP